MWIRMVKVRGPWSHLFMILIYADQVIINPVFTIDCAVNKNHTIIINDVFISLPVCLILKLGHVYVRLFYCCQGNRDAGKTVLFTQMMGVTHHSINTSCKDLGNQEMLSHYYSLALPLNFIPTNLSHTAQWQHNSQSTRTDKVLDSVHSHHNCFHNPCTTLIENTHLLILINEA